MAYDRSLAVLLADVCDWAYGWDGSGPTSPPADAAVTGALRGAPQGFRDAKPVPTSFAALLSYERCHVLVFRGTEPQVLDWIRNLEAWLVRFTLSTAAGPVDVGARVHRGFLAELEEVFPRVDGALRALPPDGRPLHVTGHSQGGAEAVLAATALTRLGRPPAVTYTFEAPRAGAASLTSVAAAPIYRFEYGHDIVPHVPPAPTTSRWWLPLTDLPKRVLLQLLPDTRRLFDSLEEGYVHVGELHYVKPGGGPHVVIDDGASETALRRERLWALLGAGKHLWEDHQPIALWRAFL